MGVVWEGWDERLQRPVAIKQLHVQPGLSDEEAELAKNRAMREARITARLDHPNAVPVFDVVEQDGRPCLVMQFLPSTPLSGVLKERGTLPAVEAARIGAQVASALASAHAVGIVHRDVKPGNILMAQDGTARISDFGISHALGDATLTSTGMVHGTPAYLAPEVALGGNSSFASDVFGLGATIYTMVEGAPPFGTDPNPIVLLHRVASGRFEPPANGGALTPVVLEMLATEPTQRPSMADVAQQLAATATAQGVDPEAFNPATLAFTRELSPADRPTVAAPAPPTPSLDPTTRITPVPPVVAAAAAAPPSSPPSDGGGASGGTTPPARSSRGSSRILLVLAALVIVALAAALLIPRLNRPGTVTAEPSPQVSQSAGPTASSDDPTPESTAPSSPPTSQSSASATSASPTSASPTPSATRSSASESPSESESSEVEGAATAKQLEDAIKSYYELMPDDRDDAWPLLTSSYQNGRVGGRGSYDGFWEDVRRVQVRKVEGNPPDKAEATIRYVYKSGREVTETTSYGLVNEGGLLKINSSTVISSG